MAVGGIGFYVVADFLSFSKIRFVQHEEMTTGVQNKIADDVIDTCFYDDEILNTPDGKDQCFEICAIGGEENTQVHYW